MDFTLINVKVEQAFCYVSDSYYGFRASKSSGCIVAGAVWKLPVLKRLEAFEEFRLGQGSR